MSGCIVTTPQIVDVDVTPIGVSSTSNTVAVETINQPVEVEVTTEPVTVEVESTPVVVEVLQNALITVPAIPKHLLFNIEVAGKTVFDLPYAIANPDKSRLYLNGQKQVYGVDYVIDASVLTYSGVTLAVTDYLEIYW